MTSSGKKTKRDDRIEVEMLRFSILKIAKLVGAATPRFQLLGSTEHDLTIIAVKQNDGWVELCNEIEDEIKWMDQLLTCSDESKRGCK